MRELLDDRPDWFDDEHTGMTLLDYEEQAMDMALYDGFLIYPAIGLAGEAGEVANKVGKMLRDNEIPPDGGEPVFDMDFEQRHSLAKERRCAVDASRVQRPGLRPQGNRYRTSKSYRPAAPKASARWR